MNPLGPFYWERSRPAPSDLGEPYLDDAVLAVHHALKRLAEDLDVLVKFPGLDFP